MKTLSTETSNFNTVIETKVFEQRVSECGILNDGFVKIHSNFSIIRVKVVISISYLDDADSMRESLVSLQISKYEIEDILSSIKLCKYSKIELKLTG